MRNLRLRVVVVVLAIVGVSPVAPAQEFAEDFESYAAGSEMHGQGGWKGWDNVAGAGAPASSTYAYSGSNSVEIIGSADLVHEFDISGGRWLVSAMQYIPSGTTGNTYFILLNTYNDGGPYDWSVQWNIDLATGVINLDLGSGTANIVYDQWVELKCIINLDENTIDEYYNGELISTHQWDDNVNGTLQCIDLYGNGASSVYYDDIKVEEFFIYNAYEPDPPDGATGVMSPLLKWQLGDTAKFHDVYLGTDETAVTNATSSDPMGPAEVYKARQAQALNMWYEIGGWIPGTTYYWRIDEVETDGTTIHTGDVWSFTAPPFEAFNPDPRDGAKWVSLDSTLTWSPGWTAVTHDVYFGTDETEVTNGTGGTFKGNQPGTTYNPGPLAADTTYYWRIDERNGTLYEGDVWSFTTVGPYAGAQGFYYEWTSATVPPPRSAAFANLVMTRIDPQINFSWSTGSPPGIRADQFAARWIADLEAPTSERYTLWTYTDDGIRVWLDGVLIIDHWVEQGATWWNSAPINLIAGQTYSLEMEYYENGGDARAELHWSSPSTPRQFIPVGPLQQPLKASSPSPANGATGATDTPTLRWKAGQKAVQHQVFFGADRDAVADADTTAAGIYRGSQALANTSYVPTENPLEWDKTYYWKVNEANGVDLWEGSVWSFTVADYLVIDDFEAYDDYCNRVFYTYGDGWGHNGDVACGVPPYGGNGTGSTVGYLSEPYAEQTITHDGSFQSMPMEYDNTGGAGKALYSETDREWAIPQDWTRKGVKHRFSRGVQPS